MSVFDEQGHVELVDFEKLCAAAHEVCADPSGTWYGGTIGLQTIDGEVVCKVELNPVEGTGPQQLIAAVGDHLVKMQPYALGYVVKRAADSCPICMAGE